jgi:hypothetical protein
MAAAFDAGSRAGATCRASAATATTRATATIEDPQNLRTKRTITKHLTRWRGPRFYLKKSTNVA